MSKNYLDIITAGGSVCATQDKAEAMVKSILKYAPEDLEWRSGRLVSDKTVVEEMVKDLEAIFARGLHPMEKIMAMLDGATVASYPLLTISLDDAEKLSYTHEVYGDTVPYEDTNHEVLDEVKKYAASLEGKEIEIYLSEESAEVLEEQGRDVNESLELFKRLKGQPYEVIYEPDADELILSFTDPLTGKTAGFGTDYIREVGSND